MDYSDAFRLVNIGVGALMITGGVLHSIYAWPHELGWGFSGLITGIYCIIFGAAVALLEFQIPPQISRYASFMFSFIGRGVFYIFIGSILLDASTFDIIFGTIIGAVGVGYVVLEFVPQIEPPSNMRDAEGGWGAEQV